MAQKIIKIAVSGKGGVGKTTLSAMLIGALALNGRSVIAVDADPDANLPSALGVPPEETLTPIGEMRDLIRERTGSTDELGGYFKLNPRVDDIPEKFARKIDQIRLLVLGGVDKGGSGCICPSSALLKALLMHLILYENEALIMDMEAGIEHLGRATAQSTDALITVVDEGPWSIQCAHRVHKLAGEIGIKKVLGVANRITDESNLEEIQKKIDPIPLIGHIPYDPRFMKGILGVDTQGALVASAAMRDNLSRARAILEQL